MEIIFAHQNAGLNRCGAFEKPSRYKADRRDEPAPRAKKNEPWRRHAGITLANEGTLTRKERRKGLRRLMRWIVKFVKREEKRASDFLHAHARTELQLLNMESRAEDVNSWECVRNGAVSLARLCEKLGLSAAKLTQLTQEIQNISGGELLDGLKLRRMRGVLMEQFKAAAFSIWGSPGALAQQRCFALGTETRRLEACATKSRRDAGDPSRRDAGGPSGLDCWAEQEETPAAELARRTSELLDAWDERQRGGIDTPLFLRLNFASRAKLDRACAVVFGKTLRQTLTGAAREIVEFYLCAEDKVLRDLACKDEELAGVLRARWLYHKSDEVPEPPFLDRWSCAKTFRTMWLIAMAKGFG
ncbi:MAG TPA: hypothetical protein VEK08_19440 [Planctomycetota bacterium]|nr:hypothetical protein [Planctomycetota bacterium]